MALERNSLALFDFDNTLSICDSFVPFSLFVAGPVKFLSGASKLFVRRLKGPVQRKEAKEIMATATLEGLKVEEIESFGKKYAEIFLSVGLNRKQLEALKKHKDDGERVIIVSASPRLCLESIAERLQVELIATEMIVEGGLITGKVSGENCRGPEKIKRLSALLNLNDYQMITAYGDSAGDKEMLEASTNPVYRGGRDGNYMFQKIYCSIVLYFRCLFS